MTSDDEVKEYLSKLVREEISKQASETVGRGGGKGGGNGVDLGEFGKFVSAAKGMKEAMTSDVDKALSQAVSTKIVDQVLPSLSNQPKGGTGFYESSAAVAFMQKLPEQLVPLVDVVFTRLGQEKAGRLVDGVTNYLSGKGGGGGGVRRTDADIIGSLDPDNPSHLHYYMSIRNMGSIDASAAKKGLIMEKENLLKGIPTTPIPNIFPGEPPTSDSMPGSMAGGTMGSTTGLENAIREQNEFIKQVINKQSENEQFMKFIYEKVEKIEKGNVLTEKRKVDIDSIGEDRGDDELGEKAVKDVKKDTISPKLGDIVTNNDTNKEKEKKNENEKKKDNINDNGKMENEGIMEEEIKKEEEIFEKEEVKKKEEKNAVVEIIKKGDILVPVFDE